MQIDGLVPLLNVENVERSITFYTGHLGFQVSQRFTASGETAWALLQCGAAKLMINRPEGADSAGRRKRASYADAVFYLYVPSARDCHAVLRAAGIVTGDVALEPYGLEEFRLRDPDGYEIAVASPVVRIA